MSREMKFLQTLFLKVTKVINVDVNRTDDYVENGLENSPYKTIQAGINIATSGMVLDIVPGTYNEDITLKPGVYLKSRLGLQPGVTITGKVSWPSGAGTILMSGIYVLNTSGHALDFGGTGVQKLRPYNCKFETNGAGTYHAINHTNTNVGSEILMKGSVAQVQDSSGGATPIETVITSQGSIGLDNSTVRVVDDIDHTAINLHGAIAYWQRMDEIRGRVIVADLASCNISLDGMYANTLSCMDTNSAGLSVLSSVILSTAASPAVTGAGVFAYSHVGYATTGQGLAGTLNGGLGAAIGVVPGEGAEGMLYDNTISGLTATKIKTAIDEMVASYQPTSGKDQANGYPGLGVDSKINSAQLPAIAITDTFTVASEVEQLALTVQKGDVAVRSDENKSYINKTGNNTEMADWEYLQTPTDAVQSVDGRVGVVALNDLYEPKNTALMVEGEDVGLLTNDSDYQSGAQVDATVLTHKEIANAHHDRPTHSPIVLNVYRTSGVIFPNNATGFCHVGGAGAVTAMESLAQIRVPAGRIKAIQGNCTDGSGSFTVRKNGVATTLTGTVSNTGQFYLTGEGTVNCAEGDLLSLYYDGGVNWTVYGIQIAYEVGVI